MQLIEKNELGVDKELVVVGCLLHDIGVYSLYDHEGVRQKELAYVTHGVRGEEILKQEGFPEVLWRFASHHTGVGLTKEDVREQNLPLPLRDYTTQTPEEALVMYSDKFHTKSTPPVFMTFEQYREYVATFGEKMVTRFDVLAARVWDT